MTLVAGLDIGGSTSRARLARDGATVREADGPTASVSAVGVDAAVDVLQHLLREIATDAESVDAVCLGTAGSGTRDVDERLAAAVREIVATPTVRVVNDAELLLPAAGFDEGAALVSGTGMKAFAVQGDRRAFSGGWGFLLGDEGSGYWIAREAVRTVLQRVDQREPLGALGERLFEVLGVSAPEQLIERFHADPAPGHWARLVPDVIGCGDPVVAEIVASAGGWLAIRVAEVLVAVDAPADSPVVLAGGVLTHLVEVAAAVRSALLAERPRLRIEVLHEPPVAGAVRLAEQAAAAAP